MAGRLGIGVCGVLVGVGFGSACDPGDGGRGGVAASGGAPWGGADDGADDDEDDDADVEGDDDDEDSGGPEDDADTLGDCAEVEVQIDTISPTVIVLVDRSWSMTEDFNGVARWDAIYRTLLHPDDGIVERMQSQISFGISLFTSDNGNQGGQCPILTEVAPALDNAEAIEDLLSAKNPVDETPTGESLAIVAHTLAAMDVEGPRAIVLATDGEPDTCAQPNPENGQALALESAAMAYELGVDVYVISVGNDVSAEHLQQMANVGLGKAPDAADAAPYYQALDTDELIDAFGDVVSDLVSCEMKIDGIVELDRACSGTVVLDGKMLQCGEDFALIDESTLTLMGDACQSLRDGGTHAVEARWPCDAIQIP